MPNYMLLLLDEPKNFANVSPAEMQAIVERYIAWGDQLKKSGKLVSSDKLTDDGGKRLTKQGGKLVVVDGPYAEAREVVGGYFVVRASGYEEAVAMCRDCPHLDFGIVDVREVESHGG